MITLTELATKYGTDKQTSQHDYMKLYERELKTIEVNSLLEVGIGRGKSLKMWREYYPDANLYGIEYFGCEENVNVHSLYKGDDIKNLTIFAGDSSKLETWSNVPYELDVIVEDGDHTPKTMVDTFLLGFEHIKSGGLYFMEDTHVGFIQPEFYKDKHSYVYDWLFGLIINQQEALDSSHVIDAPGNFYYCQDKMNETAKKIFAYHCYKSVICFQKA
jgi:hypothetical protein